MEQIIESERYACVRTGMWKKRCKVVIGKQDVGEKRTLRFKDEAVSVFYYM